jgi:hypothetical protein
MKKSTVVPQKAGSKALNDLLKINSKVNDLIIQGSSSPSRQPQYSGAGYLSTRHQNRTTYEMFKDTKSPPSKLLHHIKKVTSPRNDVLHSARVGLPYRPKETQNGGKKPATAGIGHAVPALGLKNGSTNALKGALSARVNHHDPILQRNASLTRSGSNEGGYGFLNRNKSEKKSVSPQAFKASGLLGTKKQSHLTASSVGLMNNAHWKENGEDMNGMMHQKNTEITRLMRDKDELRRAIDQLSDEIKSLKHVANILYEPTVSGIISP